MIDGKSSENSLSSKKSYIPFFIILILVNIVIRYPFTPHLLGWDSYVIYSFADSIIKMKNAVWVLNPLSYFGLYPLSYPSAVPFLISNTSQLTGMNIESVSWLYNVILGILAAFCAFILAGEFKRNFIFQFIVAFIFSTSLGLLLFTTWSLSTRGTISVIIPLLLFSVIRFQKHYQIQYLITSILLFFLSMAAHRMYIIIIPIILLYFFIDTLIRYKLIIKSRFVQSSHYKIRIQLIVISLFLALILFLSPLFGLFKDFYHSFGILGTFQEYMLSIATFARNVGPIAILSLLGIIFIATKIGKDRKDFLLLGCLIIITPMIVVGRYIDVFALIFICIYSSHGILSMIKHIKKRKKLIKTCIIIILTSTLILSIYGQLHEFDILSQPRTIDQKYLEIDGYDVAMWCKVNTPGVSIGNDPFLYRISAIAATPHLPGNSAQDIIYNFTNSSNLNTILRSPLDASFYTDSPIKDINQVGATINSYGYGIEDYAISNPRAISIIEKYKVTSLVINNEYPTPSVFADSVIHNRYRIFYNEKASIYLIDP